MHKLGLLFLIFSMLSTTTSFASNPALAEVESLVFQMDKKIKDQYSLLPDLYDQGQFERIINETISPELIPSFNTAPIRIQEELLYLHRRYVGMASFKMAGKCRNNPEFVEIYTNNSRQYLEGYLEWVHEHVKSDNSDVNLVYSAQLNSAQVCGDLGIIYSQLFPDMILEVANAEAAKPGLEFFCMAILALERGHKLYRATARGLPEYTEGLQEFVKSIFEVLKKGLLAVNASKPNIKPAFLAEIKKYNKEILHRLDASKACMIQKEIDGLGTQKTPKKTASYKKLGPRTKKVIKKNVVNNRLDGSSSVINELESYYDMDTLTDPDLQKPAIRAAYFGLIGDCLRTSSQSVVPIREKLEKLEKRLSIYTRGDANLSAAYEFLNESLDGKPFCMTIPLLTVILTNTGDVDGAIKRLEIIMDIQRRKDGAVASITNIFYAYNKLLKGENKPWLALEQLQMQQQQAKASAKKKKKAAARQATVEAIREAQAAKESELVNRQESTSRAQVPTVSVIDEDKGKEEDVFVPSQDFKTLEQLKAEQTARHEAKAAERESKKDETDSKPQMVEIPARLATPEVAEDVIPDISLADAYNLKSAAKKVDEAIESGTWQVTREQLKIYFHAMGCEYRSGRGIHEVLTLPDQINVHVPSQTFDFNSTHLMKDGEVITVFIHAGGSLVLPSWDKGYVPEYMKKQILSARNQLKLLAYKAQQEAKKAIRTDE
ncbi:MAG: hypothetical protein KBB83_02120 [Alphaproteobacteria bacterium]|nr:hypothetical protein [Alphaproteobacteria bacterium]